MLGRKKSHVNSHVRRLAKSRDKTVGRLGADLKAGRISKAEYDKQMSGMQALENNSPDHMAAGELSRAERARQAANYPRPRGW